MFFEQDEVLQEKKTSMDYYEICCHNLGRLQLPDIVFKIAAGAMRRIPRRGLNIALARQKSVKVNQNVKNIRYMLLP